MAEPLIKTAAKLIRIELINRGMTVSDLAARMNLTPDHVSNVIGGSCASAIARRRIEQILNISVWSAGLQTQASPDKSPPMNIQDRIKSSEALLRDTQTQIELLRVEDPDGTHFGLVYHDLKRHVEIFRHQLNALRKMAAEKATEPPGLPDKTENTPEAGNS